MSYVRGTDNIVQVFDTKSESVVKQRKYDDLAEIRGLHSVSGNKGLLHAIVDKQGHVFADDLMSKQKKEKAFAVKGEHVYRTYLQQHSLAVLSKGHPI